MFLRKIDKLYMLCTVIMMVIITNSAYTQIIVNTCPATTGDLTARVTSSAPSGTTVTYHTGTPATDANKFTGDATAAPVGTYYVAYYDATNSCYSPTSMPLYVAKCVKNACPATTADLTSSVSSTPPAGTTVTYHTGTPATDANKVATPASVSSGTYFASYYDAANSCYSPTSTPIVVTIETCGSTISGTVLNDTNGQSDDTVNGTGLGNPDSTPLYANLIDSSGNVVATAPVNADGTYEFTNISDGSYTVQITTNQGTVGSAKPNTELPTGWTNSGEKTGTGTGDDGTPDGEQTVNVSGSDVSDVKFGINQPATVSGQILEDVVGEGNGSTGISGITVTLKDSNGDTVKDIFGNDLTTTTAADGSYTFDNVPAGSYTIETEDKSGYYSVKDGDTTNSSDDTPANTDTNDNSIPVTVTSGETDNGNNFVDRQLADITGTVFNDTNGLSDDTVNGTGLGNPDSTPLYVNLIDSSGNVVATAPVNADGTYTLEDVPNGNYTVQVTTNQGTVGSAKPNTELPTGWKNSGEKTGTGAGDDGTPDGEQTVSIVNGLDQEDTNFGINQPAIVSGTVTEDTNGDTNGNTALGGVTITLKDSNGDTVKDIFGNDLTTTTAADGSYTFENVPAGSYTIEKTDSTGYSPVKDGDATNPSDDTPANTNTNDNSIPVTVTAGETDNGNNFVSQEAGSISGTVTEDENGDGTGTKPLGGVTLQLLDVNGDPVKDANGDNIETVTNTDGTYKFENIPPGGGYQVKQVVPSGLTPSNDSQGNNDATISNITVSSGQENTGNNFVNVVPVTISGNVSSDTTGDNVANQNLSGVTINLLDSNEAAVIGTDGNSITTTTNSDGNYSFTNIPPGNYIVEQEQPTAHASVSDTDGNSSENQITVAATSPGQTVTNQDFTEQLASLVPVTLVQFNAEKSGNDVLLSWATASEENNAKFIVEFSFNGVVFNQLTEVDGKGTSSSLNTYSTLHKGIAEQNVKIVYYRLSQVDFDGASQFVGNVLNVHFDKDENLVVYPVPAQASQSVTILGTSNLGDYKVFNASSQVVLVGKNTSNSITIKTTLFNAGLYIVQFENGKTTQLIIE